MSKCIHINVPDINDNWFFFFFKNNVFFFNTLNWIHFTIQYLQTSQRWNSNVRIEPKYNQVDLKKNICTVIYTKRTENIVPENLIWKIIIGWIFTSNGKRSNSTNYASLFKKNVSR